MSTYAQQRSSPQTSTQQAPAVADADLDSGAGATGPQAAPDIGARRPTLSRGSTGEPVRFLQRSLADLGYDIDVDGIFGRGTDETVRRFQQDRGLGVDGIVGADSWRALTNPQREDTGPEVLDEGPQSDDSLDTQQDGPQDLGPQQPGPEEQGPEPVQDATPTVDEFMASLGSLPRGGDMTAEQRALMFQLTAQMSMDQIRTCFQHRFNQPLQDTTGTWTRETARMVWEQLDVLPDGHVSGNTILAAFQAISGTGGFGPSWEAPDVVNTVQIGEDNDPAYMSVVVRHEVGHAVHADGKYMATINQWLQNTVKFWFFPPGAAGLRQWVEELGGFGRLGNGEQDTFLEHLSTYLGAGSSWAPSRTAFGDGLSSQDAGLYDNVSDNVREGIEQSPAHWYTNHANFAQGTRGKYFLNYWYGRAFYMGPEAAAVVNALGTPYTSMSEKEFFADCYAEFFKDPAGFADPSRWGGNLPGSIQAFFRTHILEQQPYSPPSPVTDGPAPAPPKPTGMAGTP